MTVIVLISKNRAKLLSRTLDALTKSRLDNTKLIAVDNGSTDGSVKLLRDSGLFNVIFENPPDTPQWQKSFAIRQAQAHATSTWGKFNYFGWIDDDMVVEPDWLCAGRAILSGIKDVAVASMHQDEKQERRHKTVRTMTVNGMTVRIKRSANGAIWLVRRGFFSSYGLPPVDGRSVMSCKKDDDTYNRRIRGKAMFGVISKSKHIGYDFSRRYLEMAKR